MTPETRRPEPRAHRRTVASRPGRLALIALAAMLLVPASAAAGGARSGGYVTSVHHEGESPGKAYARFRVARDGRRLKAFRARIWVICYIGPPLYNGRYPVRFTAPRMRISRRGRVDRRWRSSFTVDGEKEKLTGRIKLRFRGNRVRGRLWLSFARCGTTTGERVGWQLVEGRRSRKR